MFAIQHDCAISKVGERNVSKYLCLSFKTNKIGWKFINQKLCCGVFRITCFHLISLLSNNCSFSYIRHTESQLKWHKIFDKMNADVWIIVTNKRYVVLLLMEFVHIIRNLNWTVVQINRVNARWGREHKRRIISSNSSSKLAHTHHTHSL